MSDALTFDRITEDFLATQRAKALEPVDAVPTPFPSWNAACRDEGGGEGIAKGWHVILAGKSGSGKSILALNMVAAAMQAGRQVCYLSLEMSQIQLVTRLVAIVTDTGIRALERGRTYDPAVAQTAHSDFDTIAGIMGGGVAVNRRPIHSLADIALVFGNMAQNHFDVFVVDYLQLAWAGSAKSMLENITEISHTVRGLAHELGVVSIALSQYNRATSANREDRPTPEGLMGGSPLENDADQVVLLDHTSYERQGQQSAMGKLILGKNRHGPLLDIPIAYDYRTLRITETTASNLSEAA